MRHRRLGRTELSVSEVGLGGGGIGGVYGRTTVEESRRTVERALERGVNFVDVAPAYGDGLAETVVGDAVAGRRDDVFLATKVALDASGFRDVRGFVRGSVNASLSRLRTSVLDVLFLHNPVSSERGRPKQRPGDIEMITAADALRVGEELERLRADGVVRFLGFTGWRCARSALVELLDSGLFDVAQLEYNLFNRSAAIAPEPGAGVTPLETLEDDPGVEMARWAYRPIDQHRALDLAAEHDVGVVCIRPLAGGLLTAELDRPEEPGTEMELLHGRASAFGFLTAGGRPLTHAALGFCLAHPGVSTVVPGAKNAREIEEAVEAAAVRLEGEELDRISEVS
jgi:aryl-alcohol dehydrogenase-like predicted oxidoreductase